MNDPLSFLESTGGWQFGEENEQFIKFSPGLPTIASATTVTQDMHTVTAHQWKLN